jgi:hypothetical protein
MYAQTKINGVEKKRNITVERIPSTTLAGFFSNRHFLQAKASFPACKQQGLAMKRQNAGWLQPTD